MSRFTGVFVAVAASIAAIAAANPPAQERERGRELVEQYQCGSCHRIPGVRGGHGRVAPTLEGFGRRAYIAGEIPNTPLALQRWIVSPPSLVPGTRMPALGVPPAAAAAMAAYLMSLQ